VSPVAWKTPRRPASRRQGCRRPRPDCQDINLGGGQAGIELAPVLTAVCALKHATAQCSCIEGGWHLWIDRQGANIGRSQPGVGQRLDSLCVE
jgi:hypothetical protein